MLLNGMPKGKEKVTEKRFAEVVKAKIDKATTQNIASLIILVTAAVCVVKGIPLPEWMVMGVGAVVGYLFKGKI